MEKLVSIALPSYNAGAYIGECLECLLGQTYQNIEIILIDDCSTDDTSQVVSGFMDSRIRYYKNEENLGIVHTLNKAYSLCRGGYIARMDADDTCTLDRIEKQVALLDSRPDIGLVACDLQLFGAREGELRYSTDPEIIKCRMLYSLQLAHNAWLFRRELIDTHGLVYRDAYRYAEDWDFLVRASRITRFSNVPELLTGYRLFPEQSSARHKKAQRNAADRVAKDQLDYLGVKLKDDEFRVYREYFGYKEKILTVETMRMLLDILDRLEKANKKNRVYEVAALRSVIRENIYGLCYYNLMHRRKSGLCLFSTDYSKAMKLGMIKRGKLYLRSIVTLLAGKDD